MIARKLGRRKTKSPQNDVASDFYNFNFSSQESSTSRWSSSSSHQQLDPFDFDSQNDDFTLDPSSKHTNKKRQVVDNNNNNRQRLNKNKNKNKKVFDSDFDSPPVATSTLMEAQEFGEMMEHVDEVNFALDGLRIGQPLRIRRSSFLSLLNISTTMQQRRLLRTQGLSRAIIDAIFRITFDDSFINLAAAALFYALTTDGQEDQVLESATGISFLIKCLKPTISVANEDKGRKIGNRLVALCKDSDMSRDSSRMSDSSSAAIVSKVQEILISCKAMKANDAGGVKRPELDSKWIALLTMEKGCLSKISFEDTTGAIKKTGGNFKEKLRQHGGLDAIFEVALKCHSKLEVWLDNSSTPVEASKDNSDLQSLMLLLKCLKIMENATFLSEDNQNHLLKMEENLDSYGSRRITFTQLVINVTKILSGRYLQKRSASSTNSELNFCSNGTGQSEWDLIANDRVASDEPIFSQVGSSLESTWRSTDELVNAICSTEPANQSSSHSTMSGSRSGIFRSSISGILGKSNNGSTKTSSGFDFDDMANSSKESKYDCFVEESQDPFAFDEDDFKPSKWDVLSGKQNDFGAQKSKPKCRRPKKEHESPLMMSKLETGMSETCMRESSDDVVAHHTSELPCSSADEEEFSSLLDDCLLTAVKVLMNLSNENQEGCEQIAVYGGLETMASLIARHFPLFTSSYSSSVSVIEGQNDKQHQLTDQELDFLVAILGLLVNLVEKDGHNRSQLATATVSLEEEDNSVIPLLCCIFIANRGAGDNNTAGEQGKELTWNDEEAVLQGEKEAEKMIVEAYSALLLAFLSTESERIRDSIMECLPNHNLGILVPVLERFVAFHLTLNMISPETHKVVSEVIDSLKLPRETKKPSSSLS
ncbi:hypothetical protein ACFE04_020031 [Oxalis oulophora]